jgi:hypothetical protein
MNVRESFRAQLMEADATAEVGGSRVGGFLAKTSGAITVTDANGDILVDAVPVTAGIYTPIPFAFFTSAGGTVVLSGGASGTLAV